MNTASLTNTFVNSANSLSYDNGSFTVTLTGLQWVGGSGNPYISGQTVQQVTLNVTDDFATDTVVPEPSSVILLLSGLGIMGLASRRKFQAGR